jgi:hypothetical protein
MIRWRLDVMKVVTGLNVNTVDTVRPIHEACMHTGPLSSYSNAVTACAQPLYNTALEAAQITDAAAGNTTASDAVRANGVEHYINTDCLKEALGLTIAALLPRKILAKVKQSLRRDMRKPKDMKVCNYYQNIVRINNEEIPNLPLFRPLQKLSHDKLIDIVLFRTPKSWQNEMEQQGFDPMEQSLFQVIDFMERVESVEEPFKKPSPRTRTPRRRTILPLATRRNLRSSALNMGQILPMTPRIAKF